jgi:hypothetical protein
LSGIAPGFGMVFADAGDRGAGSSIEGNEVREISFGRLTHSNRRESQGLAQESSRCVHDHVGR